MFGGSNGNCSTMSVVENFFEKFEKGEVREVEREFTGADDIEGESFVTDSNGELVVAIDDLVSVESVVCVKLADPDSENYITVDEAGTTTDIVGARGYTDETELSVTIDEDNEVALKFYTDGADDGALTAVTDASLPSFKVVARGY